MASAIDFFYKKVKTCHLEEARDLLRGNDGEKIAKTCTGPQSYPLHWILRERDNSFFCLHNSDCLLIELMNRFPDALMQKDMHGYLPIHYVCTRIRALTKPMLLIAQCMSTLRPECFHVPTNANQLPIQLLLQGVCPRSSKLNQPQEQSWSSLIQFLHWANGQMDAAPCRRQLPLIPNTMVARAA